MIGLVATHGRRPAARRERLAEAVAGCQGLRRCRPRRRCREAWAECSGIVAFLSVGASRTAAGAAPGRQAQRPRRRLRRRGRAVGGAGARRPRGRRQCPGGTGFRVPRRRRRSSPLQRTASVSTPSTGSAGRSRATSAAVARAMLDGEDVHARRATRCGRCRRCRSAGSRTQELVAPARRGQRPAARRPAERRSSSSDRRPSCSASVPRATHPADEIDGLITSVLDQHGLSPLSVSRRRDRRRQGRRGRAARGVRPARVAVDHLPGRDARRGRRAQPVRASSSRRSVRPAWPRPSRCCTPVAGAVLVVPKQASAMATVAVARRTAAGSADPGRARPRCPRPAVASGRRCLGAAAVSSSGWTSTWLRCAT